MQADNSHHAVLEQIYAIYTLLKRFDQSTRNVVQVLPVWQRDFYHGSAWSAIHRHLETMHTLLSLVGDDLFLLIRLQNPDLDPAIDKRLRYQLRGNPGMSSSDVFGIWQRILARNARHKCCGWVSYHSETQGKTLDAFGELKFCPDVEKRLIFVSYYSVLLSQVKRTLELDNLSQSQWKTDIEALSLSQTPFQKRMEWYPDILNFLPEFPPSFAIKEGHTQLAEQSYALRIEVPEQEAVITEIIAHIEQSAIVLHQSVLQLQQSLKLKLADAIDIIF